MARVEWSQDVERTAFRLPRSAKTELLQAVENLRHFPEMGRLVPRGRYRGCRSLRIGAHWLLLYRVLGEERTCLLFAIRDARRRPV